MKYTNFDEVSDLVRQLRENENLLAVLNSEQISDSSSYFYLAAYAPSVNAGSNISFSDDSSLLQTLTSMMTVHKASLISTLSTFGVEIEQPAPSDPSNGPDEQPPSTDPAPDSSNSSNQSDSTTTADAPTTTDSGTPSGDPNPPVVPPADSEA